MILIVTGFCVMLGALAALAIAPVMFAIMALITKFAGVVAVILLVVAILWWQRQ